VVDGNHRAPCREAFDRQCIQPAATQLTYGESPMLDILMMIIALAFFILSVGYAYVCDQL
jgi:hypothetical protein